jgi:hypothetical protein
LKLSSREGRVRRSAKEDSGEGRSRWEKKDGSIGAGRKRKKKDEEQDRSRDPESRQAEIVTTPEERGEKE